MKVKELEAVLAGIEDKEMEVEITYDGNGLNGYYFKGTEKKSLMLTNLSVQPRI